jgi:hypothetical protein
MISEAALAASSVLTPVREITLVMGLVSVTAIKLIAELPGMTVDARP